MSIPAVPVKQEGDQPITHLGSIPEKGPEWATESITPKEVIPENISPPEDSEITQIHGSNEQKEETQKSGEKEIESDIKVNYTTTPVTTIAGGIQGFADNQENEALTNFTNIEQENGGGS